jgi:hypothetical protein
MMTAADRTECPFISKQRSLVFTLVMEEREGNRVKNLVFDHPVKAGDNVIGT